MCLLKNWTNGQLRPILLLEKRHEPLFLFTLLKLMGMKTSGRILKVEISSFALIPSACLLYWEKISSIPVLLKVIIVATPLWSFILPQYSGSGNESMHFILVRNSEASCLFYNSYKER